MSNNPYYEQCYKIYQFRPGEKPIPSVEPQLMPRLPVYMDSEEQAIQYCRERGEEILKNGIERMAIFGPNHRWVADYYLNDKGLVELASDKNGRFSETVLPTYKIYAFEISNESMQPDPTRCAFCHETKDFDTAMSWCRDNASNVLEEYCCIGIYDSNNNLLAGYMKDETQSVVEQIFANTRNSDPVQLPSVNNDTVGNKGREPSDGIYR